QQVTGIGFRVVHLGDPVPAGVEYAGVYQLVFGLQPVTPAILVDEVLVRKGRLRVVVTPPVPRVAGQRVQVPPVFLDVFAVIALRAGQPEWPFLQDRVLAIPQCQPQAQPLLDVAEPGQPVLAPPVGPGSGVIMREVVPRLAVRAVVLADRAPLPFADIRAPLIPVARLPQSVLQPPEACHAITLGAHGRPPSGCCGPAANFIRAGTAAPSPVGSEEPGGPGRPGPRPGHRPAGVPVSQPLKSGATSNGGAGRPCGRASRAAAGSAR